MSGGMLRIEEVQAGYPGPAGSRRVLHGCSFSLDRGEIGCLLGASGCGKTTLLRTVAGFEPVHAGRIVLDGATLSSPGASVPPERRRVGMMFQDYALFPHLDVAANVGFGLRGLPREARRRTVAEMLARVGMAERGDSYPHELSGGQQQRVALARAMAPGPSLLLLDEPFSNLDVQTREQLAGEVRRILKAAGTTVLLVTHDQAEAFALADRIGVVREGRILQWDSPARLYAHPADRYVADFLGRGSVVPAEAIGLERDCDVLVRPEDLRCDPEGPIHATLVARVFRGPDLDCTIRLPSGGLLKVDLPTAMEPAEGDALRFRCVDPGALPAFARGAGAGVTASSTEDASREGSRFGG